MMRALLLLAVLASAPAQARVMLAPQDREPRPVNSGIFTCNEGFTLVKTDTGYRLSGRLDTPTPGYKWEVGEINENRDGALYGSLSLTAPEGVALTVIDSIEITHDIPRGQQLAYLRLNVKKSFNWGPDEISCQAAE